MGDDADGVAEGAGGEEGDFAFEEPGGVVGVAAVLFEGGDFGGAELVAVVDAAVDDLDGDVGGSKVAELDGGADLQAGAEGAVAVAVFDLADVDCWPGARDPVLPGGQLAGGSVAVVAEAAGALCSGPVEIGRASCRERV